MSIKLKSPQALKELKDTLEIYTHIEEVHFTETGDHYFTAFELQDKGKPTGKKYGYLKVKDAVHKVIGERKFFKKVPTHTPNTLIVETLSREEVLAYKPKANTPGGQLVDAGAASAEANKDSKPKRQYSRKVKEGAASA